MLFWCQNKGKIKSKKSKMKKKESLENSLRDTLRVRFKNKTIVGSAIMICEKYLPILVKKNELGIDDGTKQVVLKVLLENPDYCRDLVKYYNTEGNSKDLLKINLSHDIAGLSKKDPHFLPRIS